MTGAGAKDDDRNTKQKKNKLGEGHSLSLSPGTKNVYHWSQLRMLSIRIDSPDLLILVLYSFPFHSFLSIRSTTTTSFRQEECQ